jgi:SRSO17 transposase
MDATEIRRLGPRLGRYLNQFDDCFARSDTRAHLPVYVQGQLSDLPRKSVEPMALAQGVPPRTLQQFVSLLDWDHDRMRQRLQQIVARDHVHAHAIGIIDETGCPKKGDKTPGVQRQYCGATGKIENCVVTVHLSYAVDDFHCLVNNELYLPESWEADRERCRAAGIPDDVVYRPKWRIALELLDQASANGLAFPWLTFDEGYGSKPEFLRELGRRRQRYVAEVPRSFTGWLKAPRLTDGTRGRGTRRRHRLRPARPASSVADLLRYYPALRDAPWQPYHVKDGQRGPMVWEAKRVRFYPQTEDGDPAMPHHLIVTRNPLQPEELKFFVSNAPADTSLSVLLLVAFARWHVERCFEDEKTELGFDHYEGRNYLGLLRHQIVTAVSHLFLARVRHELRGEKSGPDAVPGASGSRSAGAVVVAGSPSGDGPAGADRDKDHVLAARQRQGTREPYQTNPPKVTRRRHTTRSHSTMLVGRQLAL